MMKFKVKELDALSKLIIPNIKVIILAFEPVPLTMQIIENVANKIPVNIAKIKLKT